MSRSTRETARLLAATAADQGGYFTAKQAIEAGYDYPHFDYHVSVGNFQRIGHGLYRISASPRDEHDEFIRLTLWSRNRNDVPQAVVSHESALVLHDLTELMPSKTHLTVPPKFRKPAPPGCVLHKVPLLPEEVEERHGFKVTAALRTLVDVTRGGVSQEQLDKAVSEALARGLVRRAKLLEVAKASKGADRLRQAVTGRTKQPA
jgi:predicted transcriptional regulator of viral defense system